MGGDDGIPVTYWGILPPLPQTVKVPYCVWHPFIHFSTSVHLFFPQHPLYLCASNRSAD
jgi:hypothetical protein